MNKVKILYLFAGLMLVLNIVLLGYIFTSKNGRSKGPSDKKKKEERLQKQFGFDDKQMDAFKLSKKMCKEFIEKLNDTLKVKSNEYYHLDNTEPNLVKRDSLLIQINDLNSKTYLNYINHFDEIREICNEDQLKELDIFIDHLIKRKAFGQNKKRPKKKG